ncbi:ABC transporter permease [Pseudarthrobacter phenanthrenivorans]|uniref:ABC transporter permease n=1 Tax=Pseudarthrobacter phenanthrenivorans TaxID=361575 RepID=UPI002F35E0FD
MSTTTSLAPPTLPAAPARMRPRRAAKRQVARTIAVRFAGAVFVIWGVVTVTFFLSRIVSPSPATLLVPADATPEIRAAIEHQLGLDRPLWEQYLRFLQSLMQGDLGTSFMTGRPVTEDLASRLPATLELGTAALVIGIIIGILLGVVAAVQRDRILDHGIRALTVAALAMPQFWLGLVLLSLFFVSLGLLPGPIGRLPFGVAPPPPVTGWYLIDSALAGQWTTFGVSATHLVLPVVTLMFGVFSPITRVTRTAMVGALDSPYVRNARALGFPDHAIHFRYALKNAVLPVITMIANAVAFAFAGAVLVESVFGWPGVGQYALNAIQQSDFPALQGFVLYSAVLYVLIYTAVDVAYRLADPRIRTS